MANKRTILLGSVAVLAIAGGAVYYFQDDLPLPWVTPPAKPAATAKPSAPAPKAEAPKPPEVAAAPGAEAAKPAASPSPAPAGDPAALDRAIKASQSRQSELEKKVADLQKQVEMKNKQIAEMEKKASK